MYLNWLMLLKVSYYLTVIQKLTSIKHDFLAERENKSRVRLQLDSSNEVQKVRAVCHQFTALLQTLMPCSPHL